MKELFEKAGWQLKKTPALAEKPDPVAMKQADIAQAVVVPEGAKQVVKHQQNLLTIKKRHLPIDSIELDDSLPVVQRAEEIIRAIQNHQVVVLAGETGSGKTTQLPKLAMLAGRGESGRIALTQPRRLAARSVATRLSEELRSRVGEWVGVKVRFHQQIAEQTAIKVLTDGMLLAEVAGDKLLTEYDTIIVDEAHERSLNIDFLLGYLRQLIDQRPELKVIITSATIDLERFSQFFANAPIISVSGRTYPVEVRYRPLAELALEDEDVDMNIAIVNAVEELTAHDPFGDILVFLPGEADIREATEALRLAGLGNTEILPLYARQSFADQQRIFSTGGPRRIVLATNVAETSLTVPGIRHVIDSGLARIKRYSVRNKVQRLPIEAIAQASANQRKGRCGRVAPGVCIRLYSEEDFLGRPAFTEPEIQRSNLASVMLQMQALGLGSLELFPLIDPPSNKLINDGYRLLEELKAIDETGRLTALGQTLSKLPLDPRLGRVLVAAQQEGVLSEACVLAGVLSLQDPRETPADKQQAAREKHRLFDDPRSDFLSLLNLWQAYEEQRKHLTKNKLKNWCQKHYISERRMREWHELVNQLHQSVSDLKWSLSPLAEKQVKETETEATPAFSDQLAYNLHRALLAGLLGQVALRDERTRQYQGARGVQLAIHPSSVLAKRSSKWIMAFEWLETSRTWARVVAEIDVAWLEDLAAHVLKRQVHSPFWSKKQGRVLAKETLSLYGLIIAADRPTDFGKYDPEQAHAIFVRDGLVTGELNAKWPFLAKNHALMNEALDWEDKTRRSDILVDDEALAQFYFSSLPHSICRVVSLDRWIKAEPDRMTQLIMTREDVFLKEVDSVQDFPNRLKLANKLNLPLSYKFAPGDEADGMTVKITLAQLSLLNMDTLARLVPGLLPQKIEAIIRFLPKPLRVRLQPAAEQAKIAAEAIKNHHQLPFDILLAQQLSRQANQLITAQDWQGISFAQHLSPRIELRDVNQKLLTTSRSLLELQERFAKEARKALLEQSAVLETNELDQADLTSWIWETIPLTQKIASGGVAWLALSISTEGVQLVPLPAQSEADHIHAMGVRRLIKYALNQPIAGIRKEWLKHQGLCLPWARWNRTCSDLVEQLIDRSIDELSPNASNVRSKLDFEALTASVRGNLTGQVRDYAKQCQQMLQQGQQLLAQCDELQTPTRQANIEQVRSFLLTHLSASFVKNMSTTGWRDTPRYLKAAGYRLEKIGENLALDERRMREFEAVERLVENALNKGIAQQNPQLFAQIQSMATELWVMIFAQPLAQKGVASLKRLEALLQVF